LKQPFAFIASLQIVRGDVEWSGGRGRMVAAESSPVIEVSKDIPVRGP
jgi:hypothetical protein